MLGQLRLGLSVHRTGGDFAHHLCPGGLRQWLWIIVLIHLLGGRLGCIGGSLFQEMVCKIIE